MSCCSLVRPSNYYKHVDYLVHKTTEPFTTWKGPRSFYTEAKISYSFIALSFAAVTVKLTFGDYPTSSEIHRNFNQFTLTYLQALPPYNICKQDAC